MSEEQKTAVEFAGVKLSGGKMLLLLPILSSLGGALWGGFEFYKSYQNMQKKIESYVSPDLTGFDKNLAVLEESIKTVRNEMVALKNIVNQGTDYTRDIKNDIKSDIRNMEKVVEQVERDAKQNQREMERDLRTLRNDIDSKIQKALENPLSNMATTK